MISVVIANLVNDDPCYVSVCSRDCTITSNSNYIHPSRFCANVSTYGDTDDYFDHCCNAFILLSVDSLMLILTYQPNFLQVWIVVFDFDN